MVFFYWLAEVPGVALIILKTFCQKKYFQFKVLLQINIYNLNNYIG